MKERRSCPALAEASIVELGRLKQREIDIYMTPIALGENTSSQHKKMKDVRAKLSDHTPISYPSTKTEGMNR